MITNRSDVRLATWVLLAVMVGGPTLARAQAASGAAAGASMQAPADGSQPVTPADLARIRLALSTSPSLNLDQEQLRYYARILAKQTNFSDFTKGYDFINGPTRGGNPMSHAEFLNMVTPKEMNGSSGGITPMETLQYAFTNWLGQSLVKKAIEDMRNAKDQHEIDAIRERIEQELAALKPPAGSN